MHSSLKNKKILITCGPTWVRIDGFRVITNRSTGKLGQLLAKGLANRKARVTLLEGQVKTPLTGTDVKVIKFSFFDELLAALKKELRQKFDIVIHAAAVSDYKLKSPFKTKLKSGIRNLSLTLIPTEKIINQIKRINKKCFLVGFKQESTINQAAARKKAAALIKQAQCDLIVANSANKSYKAFIVDKNLKIKSESICSREKLVKKLIKTIQEEI